MLIDYQELEKETVKILETTKNMVLSTSFIDKITSRSMSIINMGLDVYFQTNKKYTKYSQMIKNPNVSLCFGNMSIEGTAAEIGSWKDENNNDLMELYKSKHLSSYNRYGNLDGQVVFRITPKKISYWKYSSQDNDPYREILYVDKKMAERIEF
jgi:general stress protein 26